MNTHSLSLSVDLRKELAKEIADYWQSNREINGQIIDLILQNDGNCYIAVLCLLEEAWITSEAFFEQSMNLVIKAVFHDLVEEVSARYAHHANNARRHYVLLNG